MGLFGAFAEIASIAEAQAEAKDIIRTGLDDALSTMEGMIGNEGQQSVYDTYVVPAFKENASASVDDGWTDVDIGDYMDFMGDIVNEGNSIMSDAYEQAAEVVEEYLF